MQTNNLTTTRARRTARHRLWRALALTGLALSVFAVAACGAVGSDDSTQGATSSAGEGGVAMGFPEIAPAPSSPGAMPPGGVTAGGMDGSFRPDDSFAPQEESGLGLTNALGRSVIRNGHMELVVESVEDSFQQVRQITESTGGYVSGSTFTGRGETQRAYLTLRIPADQFDGVIERLRGIAVDVETASTTTQDVTEEYADLQARLRTQQAVEQQYLTLLREATNIGEILEVQDRLSWTRYEIERVQGRLNFLDSLTSLATLEVSLVPESDGTVGDKDPAFGNRVRDSWENSLATLAGIGTGIVVAVVWGWWLAILGLIAALIAVRLVRRWARSPKQPEASAGDAREVTRVDTPDGAA